MIKVSRRSRTVGFGLVGSCAMLIAAGCTQIDGSLPYRPPVSDNDSSALVRRTQSLLNDQGYDAGPADGVMGARTSVAIRDYQRNMGLKQDGRATLQLVRALQSPQSAHASAQASQPASQGGQADDRRLAPGDHVAIRVSDPNGGGETRHDLTISPNGDLALPDGGSIHAAGMRRPDLENAVAVAILERHLRDLSVKVDVDPPAAQAGGPSSP